jgi:hypothetical protein
MSKPQVIVVAAPDGTVSVETVGVVGPGCEKLSAAIEAAIGKAESNVLKPEHGQSCSWQPANQAAAKGAG